jgi:subtilisin family serine protease
VALTTAAAIAAAQSSVASTQSPASPQTFASPQTSASRITGTAAKAGSTAGETVRTVTLITGDQAQVTTDAQGRQTTSLLPAADGSVPLYFTRQQNGEQYPAIHGVAFHAAKQDLKTTLAGLVDPAGHGAAGLTKLWLDQKVKTTLQSEDQQIGAPAAWAAGLTGAGVKVAVLDTGIDAAHPDLQGRIAAAENFTDPAPDTDVHDAVGHGTFVASEIAGSGAASGGAQRGVADGAALYVGKVLDDTGSGTDSQIIAGMQWAVDSGADVASMSLGSQDPSDCTDPMSQAAENLAATGRTLFVVAAGNIGRYESVSSPGCAPDVLTVGAVAKLGSATLTVPAGATA